MSLLWLHKYQSRVVFLEQMSRKVLVAESLSVVRAPICLS